MVDKAEFIEKAPAYYALAIISYFVNQGRAITIQGLVDHYTIQPGLFNAD